MKDLTVTTFGWVIAYILPGLLGLYAISFWSATVKQQLSAFSQAESTVGLFLLVLLTALLIGLELSAVRWILFECCVCRKKRLPPSEFANLQTQDKIATLRVVVDAHYSYHQFWGGLTPVIPFFFLGFAKSESVDLCSREGFAVTAAALLVEAVTVAAAIEAYHRYVDRAKAILRGTNHA